MNKNQYAKLQIAKHNYPPPASEKLNSKFNYKNICKAFWLIFLISIINSCKKDNFSSQTKIEQGRVAKNVSIADLQKAISSNASVDLNKITAQSTGSQSIEDFFIDTTQILETKNNSNSYFYSMQLLSKKQNTRKYFYNYFIIKDSLGRVKKYIIKFTPTAETIKNKYKNFKGTYEVMPEIATSTGQIRSNSLNIVSNGIGCMEVAYDIPCEYDYVHGEGNGPGPWCNGTGSYKLFLEICNGSGTGNIGANTGTVNTGNNGNDNGSGNGSSNILVPPTFYANNIVQCDEAVVDDFIHNVYYNNLNFAFNHTNEFNQIVGGLCGNFSEPRKEEIIDFLTYLSADSYVNQIALQNYDDNLSNYTNENDSTHISFDFLNDQWPSIPSVIPTSQFVGFDGRNCLALARAQLAVKGLTDLGSGNVFQAYQFNSGYDIIAAKNGIEYIISKLKKGDPVMVGVDNQPGSPRENPDKTTDHFVVIVGSGTDQKGNYLLFYENATTNIIFGTSKFNKLYYNSQTGKITGRTSSGYANAPGHYDYIVTHIRKNK